MNNAVKIANFTIGEGHPCFIIAEAGVNHNGDMGLAHELIDAAYESGANAVKFQSFKAEELVTPQAMKASYQLKTTGKNGNQMEMLRKLELSYDQQKKLKEHCDKLGILYLCTPYENSSAALLKSLNVSAYKIASTDTNNIPFLKYIAQFDIPVILSTGMSSLGEVEEAVLTLQENGLTGKIVLLHCTSEYPSPVNELNLRAMKTMKLAFRCPVGFSDHVAGIEASSWSVAAGGCVIEKHFTLDTSMEGPDHRASIEPIEFKKLVRTIRAVEAALGDGCKQLMPCEIDNKIQMRKSVVTTKNILDGEIISANDLACKRPGSGLPPKWLEKIIGKTAGKNISCGEILKLDSINWT